MEKVKEYRKNEEKEKQERMEKGGRNKNDIKEGRKWTRKKLDKMKVDLLDSTIMTLVQNSISQQWSYF